MREKVLLEHEVQAAEIISQKPRVLLFDAMGTGKTVSVLEGLKRVSKQVVGAYKVIVSAPNTIIDQWVQEISLWLGWECVVALGDIETRKLKYNHFMTTDKTQILLTNYQLIAKGELTGIKANALVLDEGYLFRNTSTKLYHYLKESYVQAFEKVVVLSGNLHSLSDKQFYNMVDMIWPGEFIKHPKLQLKYLLGDRIISREMKDLSENKILPVEIPKINLIGQELSDEQKRLLAELAVKENQAMKSADSYSSKKFYRKRLDILRSPRIDDKMLQVSPKEDFLKGVLDSIKEKVVIYCPDRRFFKLVKSDLNGMDIKFSVVSGDMPLHIRNRNLNLFKLDDQVKCLLISGVGKFGLNLQNSNQLVCMGVPVKAFDLEQMLGRLNRINQDKQVQCYIPYHLDTDEEKQAKVLEKIFS